MKIEAFRSVKRSEIPSAPAGSEWVDDLLQSRDAALTAITQALSRRLTLADNCNMEVRLLDVLDDTEVTLQHKTLSGPPIGVVLLWTSAFDYAQVAWQQVDSERIRLKVKFDTPPAAYVSVRVAIIGS